MARHHAFELDVQACAGAAQLRFAEGAVGRPEPARRGDRVELRGGVARVVGDRGAAQVGLGEPAYGDRTAERAVLGGT